MFVSNPGQDNREALDRACSLPTYTLKRKKKEEETVYAYESSEKRFK